MNDRLKRAFLNWLLRHLKRDAERAAETVKQRAEQIADVRRMLASLALLLFAAIASAQTYDTQAVCRTPGYWATHAGTQKGGSRDLAGELLTSWNASHSRPMAICGQELTNTEVGVTDSVLEALCVDPKSGDRIALARELTAAALNCILSTSVGDGLSCSVEGENPCSAIFGEQIYDAFEECNLACQSGDVPEDCIGHLDCWNNGGTFDAATGNCYDMDDSCAFHEAVGVCFDFSGYQPPGSSKACMFARKNRVTIFGPGN